ncbi:MAG: GNAT family N-acetyltransferase [Anaerolineae bacterium]|nr:GNAT family N-acetyltransferase [Anaerolineae bacterium]
MKVVQRLDEPSWRAFVDNHPQGNIFHTPEMFQVFARAKGHRPTLWATTDDDGQVLALLLPVQITLKGGPLRRLTTRAVVYGSVLCAPGPEGQEALALLLRTYTQQVNGAPLFTELRNLSDLTAVQPILQTHGFAYEDHLNYLINLTLPPETLFQNIGARTRKHIRRALRQGEVVIEEVTKREQIATCYDFLCRTYRAARVPLADRSLFETAFDVLHPKGMVRFTVARVGQIPVVTSVELLYKDTVYGWYGGVDRAYSSYRPNELLMWHILQWSAENNYKVYDFGGAGKPNEKYGVRDFKAKFGGTLVNYGRNTYVHNRYLLHLSALGYRVYRGLKRL